jgi:hypothetical protein
MAMAEVTEKMKNDVLAAIEHRKTMLQTFLSKIGDS